MILFLQYPMLQRLLSFSKSAVSLPRSKSFFQLAKLSQSPALGAAVERWCASRCQPVAKQLLCSPWLFLDQLNTSAHSEWTSSSTVAQELPQISSSKSKGIADTNRELGVPSKGKRKTNLGKWSYLTFTTQKHFAFMMLVKLASRVLKSFRKTTAT